MASHKRSRYNFHTLGHDSVSRIDHLFGDELFNSSGDSVNSTFSYMSVSSSDISISFDIPSHSDSSNTADNSSLDSKDSSTISTASTSTSSSDSYTNSSMSESSSSGNG